MSQDAYLLKILSGPHQGAEVALGVGDYVIGSDPEVDVILSDALINPKHLKITVTADSQLQLTPLDFPVYLNGHELKKEPYPVEPFQFISLGTTQLIIGPVGQEWPQISIADAPALVREVEESVSEETVLNEGENGDSELENKESGTVSDEGAFSHLSDDAQEGKELTKMGYVQELIQKNKVMAGIAAGVLVMLISASVFLVMTSSNEDQDNFVNVDTTFQAVKKVIKDFDQENNFFVREEGDKIFIEGWVDDKEKKKEIESSLMRLSDKMSMRIWSKEKIMEDAQELLAMMKVNVAIQATEENGVYKAIGFIGDDKVWANVRKTLAADIAGIRYLEEDVLTGKKAVAIANKVLAEYDLQGKIDFIPKLDYIVLDGTITDAQLEAWKAARLKIWEEYNYPVPMENRVFIARADKIYLNTEIDGVNIGHGNNGWIVVKGGQKVFTGGVLPGGFTVKSIGKEGIVLKRGDQLITLQPGGNI